LGDPDYGLSDKDRRESLLTAIQSISHDVSKRRLEAMAAAEKVRRVTLAARVDPFEEELTGYVKEHRFRRSVNIEDVERERERRNRELLFGTSSATTASG